MRNAVPPRLAQAGKGAQKKGAHLQGRLHGAPKHRTRGAGRGRQQHVPAPSHRFYTGHPPLPQMACHQRRRPAPACMRGAVLLRGQAGRCRAFAWQGCAALKSSGTGRVSGLLVPGGWGGAAVHMPHLMPLAWPPSFALPRFFPRTCAGWGRGSGAPRGPCSAARRAQHAPRPAGGRAGRQAVGQRAQWMRLLEAAEPVCTAGTARERGGERRAALARGSKARGALGCGA